jgi:predicted O-methyltransferase YrrM
MPYPYRLEIPDLVQRAHEHAISLGFPLMPEGRPIDRPAPTTATTPMDGALLRSLASAHPRGIIGEMGTGPGVSTAWLVSGMSVDTQLVSCDIDEVLVGSVRTLFRDYPNVEILCGGWEEVLVPLGPFDLLFFDANAHAVLSSPDGWSRTMDCLKLGGQIVMDDLIPVEMWPESWRGMRDHKREFCLANDRIAGVEVRTSAMTVSVIGTRVK